MAQTGGLGIGRVGIGGCDVVCLVNCGVFEDIYEYRKGGKSNNKVVALVVVYAWITNILDGSADV